MTKGREESDGLVVPQSRRKAASTVGATRRGGKGTTAREVAEQLELILETAESPKGDDGGRDRGRPQPQPRAVPKSRSTTGRALTAMTIEEVAREENLREAFRKVASNDGAPGPDRQTVEQVQQRLDAIVPVLSRELTTGEYRPGDIRRVWIPKTGGGERGLGIPNVIDRIVQQAVAQVLSPHYEPTFHPSSHGFRPGRSCHTAIAEAKRHLEEGYGIVVDLDLDKFFDRVHWERLLARLGKLVKDDRLIALIRRMLKARVVMPDGVVVTTEEGTPQGGPLSPLLSNIVLDELDWELSRRGHRFVRYADDQNIYVRSQRAGERVMANVRDFIERKLRLKVNLAKSAVAKPEERHFLGFRLRRDPEDGAVEVDLSKRSKERVDEKIRRDSGTNATKSGCPHQAPTPCGAAEALAEQALDRAPTHQARVSTEEGLANGLRGATTPLGPEPNCGGAEESPKRILRKAGTVLADGMARTEEGTRARPGTAQSGAGTGIAAGAQALAPA